MDGAPLGSAGAPPTAATWPSAAGGLAERLAALVSDLHEAPSHQEVLDRAAEAAVALVPGAQDAGVCLLRAGRRVSPASSTGSLVARLDELQLETGQGPCWDAALHGRATRVAELAAEDERWPELAARSRGLGVVSVLCLHLHAGSTSLGAVKLLSAVPGAFDEAAEQVATLLATHAGKAIADTHQLENLQAALARRDVIGQAKGVLMERHRITAEQAFEVLARTSQHTNRKLHDVAVELTTTGELPHR